MSTLIAESKVTEVPPETPEANVEPEHGPDLSALVDRVPAQWRASRVLAASVFWLGILYTFLSRLPVYHTDVWGHLAYGRWIWQHGALPETDPLMPLFAGMPWSSSCWLAEVAGFGVAKWLGVAGLQALPALIAVGCVAALWHMTYAKTQRFATLAVAAVVFLVLAWPYFHVVRPQLLGMLAMTWLLNRLCRSRVSLFDWICLPVVFALWANFHGSFLLGLAVCGAFFVGRSLDVLWCTRSVSMVLSEQQVRRYGVWLLLAAAACLVNPRGVGIVLEGVRLSQNPNLQQLTEWQPLTLRMASGQVFAVSVVALCLLMRWTPRRIASWEPLVLFGFGAATLYSGRFLAWWCPVAAYLLTLHGHAVWRHWWRAPLFGPASPTAGKWSIVVVGLGWIFWAWNPVGIKLLHGRDPVLAKAVSAETPLGALRYLQKNAPQGQVYNTYEWGDFLLWAGPANTQWFVNSHAHLAPREVWQAYLNIAELSGPWEEHLDRYGVNTLVIDQQYRKPLIKKLRESSKWQVRFEDATSAVITRVKPIGAPADSPSPEPTAAPADDVSLEI